MSNTHPIVRMSIGMLILGQAPLWQNPKTRGHIAHMTWDSAAVWSADLEMPRIGGLGHASRSLKSPRGQSN